MNYNELIVIAVYTAVIVILSILIVKELLNIKELKQVFTCKHCNTFNTKLSNGIRCIKCNRTFSNIEKHWEHYLMFRVSTIDTKIKKVEFDYNYYIKQCKKELAICIICMLLVVSAIILTLIG